MDDWERLLEIIERLADLTAELRERVHPIGSAPLAWSEEYALLIGQLAVLDLRESSFGRSHADRLLVTAIALEKAATPSFRAPRVGDALSLAAADLRSGESFVQRDPTGGAEDADLGWTKRLRDAREAVDRQDKAELLETAERLIRIGARTVASAYRSWRIHSGDLFRARDV